MNETMIKLRILMHAEYTLARVNLRRLVNKTILATVAIGLVLLVVVMTNVGAHVLLTESYGAAKGAFLLAGGNAVLAALVILAARQLKPGPEEEMVQEIRQLTLAELSADAEGIRQNFASIAKDVKGIQSGFSAIGGGIGAGLTSLGPLIGLLVETLKNRRK
jgi:hypothetical protein